MEENGFFLKEKPTPESTPLTKFTHVGTWVALYSTIDSKVRFLHFIKKLTVGTVLKAFSGGINRVLLIKKYFSNHLSFIGDATSD